tara:strand:+ start:333 stop:791 length:459 start_codon:yes stop_codon:yes gene_type:complete
MRTATLSDLNEICRIKNLHGKWFAHLRNDKIKQRIIDKQVIFQDGVVIIFSIATKMYAKIGRDTSVNIPRGATVLHNIFKDKTASAKELMKEFLKSQQRDIYLSVRKDNILAINFYVKMGFDRVGYHNWKDGELKGSVYCWRKGGKLDEFLR